MVTQTKVQMSGHSGSREWGEGMQDIGRRTQEKRRVPLSLDHSWGGTAAVPGGMAFIVSVEKTVGPLAQREGSRVGEG